MDNPKVKLDLAVKRQLQFQEAMRKLSEQIRKEKAEAAAKKAAAG